MIPIVSQIPIIAGPCSAESESQVLETAQGLHALGIQQFRAGVWKPRTRPNTFEGIGVSALPWLQLVQKEYNMKVSCEVASAKHVEACLEHGIDALWIGARTTVNPFLVEELASSLQGTHIPVFIKNPIHAEIGLWKGAVERFLQKDVMQLAQIFRGFFTSNSHPYRNEPKWTIPLEMKRCYPELPMYCDPSHICGRRDLLEMVAQTALDLNFDGLMIETHCNPEKALSDSNQQVTPANLEKMLRALEVKRNQFTDSDIQKKLATIRTSIDEIDYAMLELLAKRFSHLDTIGMWKRDNKVSVFQLERYQEILTDRIRHASKNSAVQEALVSELFELIHKYSIAHQTKINFQKP